MSQKFVWSADNPDGELVDLTAEEIAEIEANAAAKDQTPLYVFERREAYPSIGDQLDALFHAGVFPEEMAAKIQAVKDQYPKPE